MVSDRAYCMAVREHYIRNWGGNPVVVRWARGPAHELGPEFSVLKFAPSKGREMWTFATVGMSSASIAPTIEVHLFSRAPDESQVELLTVIAHYHRTGARLDLSHTVNFGRPWLAGSVCEYGLLSLPYLDGPNLEYLQINDLKVHFLWLIPMTQREREFKKRNGVEAIEKCWEDSQFNYLDPLRPSCI